MADILRTSCQLMAEKGFHGTSMRDLAHATGRSVSGLYHHFRGKEDLLFLINYHGFTTLNDSWAQLEDSFRTPEQRLYAFVFFHTGYFVEHIDQMRVMTWGTHAMNLEKARIVQSLKNRYTDAARRILRDVCRADATNAVDAQRLERLTFLLFGMMNWVFGWYSRRRHGDVAELARDIYRTSLAGLHASTASQPDLDAAEAVVRTWFRHDKTASMWLDRETPPVRGGRYSKEGPLS
jgi:AcrR family transcriptional regulator